MRLITLITLISFLFSCQENNLTGGDQDLTWTIDTEYMRQGCYSGRDCIPSLENPSRSSVDGTGITFLADNDLVVGVWNGTNHVAYPHSVLDWHEIVNEDGYTISYCPLTGSAIHIAGDGDYGVSGLLYNSNLIMYDRDTESFWPQMLLNSAAGSRSGSELHLNNVVETTWGNWKKLFPGTQVINSNTGFSRDYFKYPYGSYKSCNSISCGDFIYFPVANSDERLKAKARVLTIINDNSVKALNITSFSTPTVVQVDINGLQHVAIISGNDNIAVAFQTVRNITIESWNIAGGEIILKEAGSENRWDITGQNLAVASASDRLKASNGYIAFWFSVAAFFPDVGIVTG